MSKQTILTFQYTQLRLVSVMCLSFLIESINSRRPLIPAYTALLVLFRKVALYEVNFDRVAH